jgi:hypothetical protein
MSIYAYENLGAYSKFDSKFNMILNKYGVK